jgi:hypothetical protein
VRALIFSTEDNSRYKCGFAMMESLCITVIVPYSVGDMVVESGIKNIKDTLILLYGRGKNIIANHKRAKIETERVLERIFESTFYGLLGFADSENVSIAGSPIPSPGVIFPLLFDGHTPPLFSLKNYRYFQYTLYSFRLIFVKL